MKSPRKYNKSAWVLVHHPDSNRVLMIKRHRDSPNPRKWNFPGGGIDKGETPRATATRELREETGLEVHPHHLMPIGHIGGRAHLFLYRTHHQFEPKLDPNESEGHHWFHVSKLPKKLHPVTKYFTQQKFEQTPRFKVKKVTANIHFEISASTSELTNVSLYAGKQELGYYRWHPKRRKLYNLYVNPNYRGKQIAKVLLHDCMERFGLPIKLEARIDLTENGLSQKTLENFYQHYGFELNSHTNQLELSLGSKVKSRIAVFGSSIEEILARKHRKATNDEIIHHNASAIKYGRKVQYRHFVREMLHNKSKTGVQHREYAKSLLHVIDRIPHVKHQGKLEKLTASHTTLGDGTSFIHDLRLDSPYLKGIEEK